MPSYTHFNWMLSLALTLRKRYEDAYDKKHILKINEYQA